MATVLGDYADQSRFHGTSAPFYAESPLRQSPHAPARYRSGSQTSPADAPARRQPAHSSPREVALPSGGGYRSEGARTSSQTQRRYEPLADAVSGPEEQRHQHSGSNGASRFPSPPSSSSTSLAGDARAAQNAQSRSPNPYTATASAEASEQVLTGAGPNLSATAGIALQRPGAGTMPSPESDGDERWPSSSSNVPHNSQPAMLSPPQTTVRVRDLAHIQSLARADLLTGNGPGILNDPPLQAMRYEISAMPIGDIIEMVAALLTKITTTNDLQHDALNRNATHIRQAQAANNTSSDNTTSSGIAGGGSETPGSGGHSNMSPLASSVLAFHGKNVPAITILSYLSRIHKYCPTTYEVFLSLLVYFDRMTERVNDLVMRSEEARRMSVPAALDGGREAGSADAGQGAGGAEADTVMRDAESDDSDELDSDLADDDDDDDDNGNDHEAVEEEPAPRPPQPSDVPRAPRGSTGSSGGAAVRANVPPATSAAAAQATYFVVDSFNIHRLIIAGVTCASKFFSDVFYTNSRYAKVGGLPLAELNHLELQFLLLNDFRLAVPVEDLEAYATMLVEFYAREVVAQRSRPVGGSMES